MTTPVNRNGEQRSYNILVYGIERKGLKAPSTELTDRNYRLTFEPFNTFKRFNEFDGVILFQGTFEKFENKPDWSGWSYLEHTCDPNELDKRQKEADLLLNNKGFICVILTDPFIDWHDHKNFESTDLAKVLLNYPSFYRSNFSQRITAVDPKRAEFSRFLELYGAANSHFQQHNRNVEWRVIATVDKETVGMIMWDELFFVPSLLPENLPDRIEEYFRLLAEALTSTFNKLVKEVPEWADVFRFSEEEDLVRKRSELLQQVDKVDHRLGTLRGFKRILLSDGDRLTDDVTDLLQNGFGLKVDRYDAYREDFKILNDEGHPIIFGEIKGTNRGVQREPVNQADNHRERAGLQQNFPTVLIINTHIKNARNLAEKDQEVPSEQVSHAKRNNVLILRTLDLLCLLKLTLDNKLSRQEVLELLRTCSGWLKVTKDTWEVRGTETPELTNEAKL